MAKYSIEDTTLTNIAEAIRTKGNTTETLTPLQMPDAINAIQTGGGGGGTSTGEFIGKTPEEIYAETRPSDWPVLPEPTQNNEFYFLCKNYSTGKVILPYCGSKMTVEWGYIDDNGAFVVVHSYNQGNALTYWSYTSITNQWVSPQMDKYYVMRTVGGDCSTEKAASSTVNSSTMKYVLEVKARVENPRFMTPTSDSSYYTNGMTGCHYITLYGPQNWTKPEYKFNEMGSLIAIVFKDDNPFAKPSTATSVYKMFYACYSLATPYDELFKNWTNLTTVSSAYYYCYSLEELNIDLSNNTALAEIGYICYGAKSVKRFSLKAPYITKGYGGFQAADTYRLIVTDLDLSGHTAPTTVYSGVAYAAEIHNLKLNTTAMTGSNPANGGSHLRRLTMAPDATQDNVPSSWKIQLKYATYPALKEFIQSLPVTTSSKSLTITNYQMATAGIVSDLQELAVSKGYTLAFAI